MTQYAITIDGHPYQGEGEPIPANPTGAGWSGRSPTTMSTIKLGAKGETPMPIPGRTCLRSHVDRIMRQNGYEFTFTSLTIHTLR